MTHRVIGNCRPDGGGEFRRPTPVLCEHPFYADMPGYRRVHAALARRGEHCSAELKRLIEGMNRDRADVGFDPVQALRTITALSNYVHGFILQEQKAQQSAAHGPVTRDHLADLLTDGHAAPLLVAFAEGGEPLQRSIFRTRAARSDRGMCRRLESPYR